MRKILTLSLLLSAAAISAKEVSPQEAQKAADDFFKSHGKSAIPLQTRGSDPGQPYYVFNAPNEEGFVLISGDDRFNKVLGYSDTGTFNAAKMPPQLKTLLENFTKTAASASGATHPSWGNASSATRSDEGVLLTTANWGQDAPYNADCPIIDEMQAPTGCVATSMAIVMKYHNWPQTYDWDAMPMEIAKDDENPPVANPALSKLMKDAGAAVYMAYGPNESGANMNWVGHRMQQVFNYSPDCQLISASGFSNDEWTKLIKSNLEEGNPVIYQGAGEEGFSSHAFVIDGYTADTYHINWGWDGWFNGYYALDALSPNEAQDFSWHNSMVINIVPDKSGNRYSPDCFTDAGYFYGIGDNPAIMNISVENVEKGKPFTLTNSLFTFMKGFHGELGIALVDKDGKIKEVINSSHWDTSLDDREVFEGHSVYFFDNVVNSEIEPTDRIQLVTKKDGDNDYLLVLGTLEWPSYVGVAGNKPKVGKVKFTIGEGVDFSYGIDAYYEDGIWKSTQLEPGTYELSDILQGLSIVYACGPKDKESGNPVNLSITGNLVYGDQKYSIKDVWRNSFGIQGDSYEVNAQVIVLKEETVTIETAGTLKDAIPADECESLKKLTVTGKMNALDFWHLRNHASSLEYLDLSKVTVEGVTAEDTKFVQFDRNPENQANHLPEWALAELRNLEVILLPESLTALESYSLCTMNLNAIKIPASVESIGLNVLFFNPNLMAVEVGNPEPVFIHECVFTDTKCPATGILYVPEGSSARYRDAAVWGEFNQIIEGTMPEQIKSEAKIEGVNYACFLNTATVTSYDGEEANVVIPETITVNGNIVNVTALAEGAFANNTVLESITLPEQITEIAPHAFNFCSNLKSVKSKGKLKRIRYYAFAWCPNLTELELGDELEELEYNCLEGTGLESIYINKNVVIDDSRMSPFGDNKNLKEFVVEDGNRFFVAIDGVLYRKSEDGLALECVPGQMEGTIALPDNCTSVMAGAIRVEKLNRVIFNPNCEVISANVIEGNNSIKQVALPMHAVVYPNAFYGCEALEAVTFTGNLKMHEEIFAYCPNLTNLVVDTEGEEVELDGVFNKSGSTATINIFTPATERNFSYSSDCVIFVPGAAASGYESTRASEVKEMWSYRLDRKENKLEILPAVEGVTIDKVIINGKEVTPEEGLYSLEEADNLDVKVEFTLMDYRKLTTVYSKEFNSRVEHTDVSSVDENIGGSSELIDIYTIDGILYLKGVRQETISGLSTGVYIVRQGDKTRKIAIVR